MADYPPNEIVDMILVLGECHNNCRAVARRYAERFSGRTSKSHNDTEINTKSSRRTACSSTQAPRI